MNPLEQLLNLIIGFFQSILNVIVVFFQVIVSFLQGLLNIFKGVFGG